MLDQNNGVCTHGINAASSGKRVGNMSVYGLKWIAAWTIDVPHYRYLASDKERWQYIDLGFGYEMTLAELFGDSVLGLGNGQTHDRNIAYKRKTYCAGLGNAGGHGRGAADRG